MKSSSRLIGAIAFLSAVISWGCLPPIQTPQQPKQTATPTPPVESSTPAPESPRVDRPPQLQPCLVDLEGPLLLPLQLTPSAHISNQTAYYVAYSTKTLADSKDIGKVKALRTLALTTGQCQILTLDQAQTLAKQALKNNRNYQEQLALHQGNQGPAWSAMVNRWERDHYVSGPGDHPLVLSLEEIWMAKTLNLDLPDYLPVYARP